MSVATTTPYTSELGDGSKTAFDFAFKIFSTDDLVVKKETAAGVYTTQTIVPDWTGDPEAVPEANTCWVEFDTDAETGTVHYSSAVTSALHSFIGRASTATQSSDFPANDPMKFLAMENALDKLTLLVQELKTEIGRAAKQADVPVPPTDFIISTPTDNTAVYWNEVDGKYYLTSSGISLTELEEALTEAQLYANQAAASAVSAAASAAEAVAESSGLLADRPAAPTTSLQYWATDVQQLFKYSVAAARWFLIG